MSQISIRLIRRVFVSLIQIHIGVLHKSVIYIGAKLFKKTQQVELKITIHNIQMQALINSDSYCKTVT